MDPKGIDLSPQNAPDIFAGFSVGENEIRETLVGYAPRPGFNLSGQPIELNANMYAVRFVRARGQAPTVFQYDVDIIPVVKVTNQKKPKPLCQAVWSQACAEATGDLRTALDLTAYDLAKIAFSPLQLPLEGSKLEILVALKENGGELEHERRRFKVIIQPALDRKGHLKTVDLETIMDFCKANKQSLEVQEMMPFRFSSVKILLKGSNLLALKANASLAWACSDFSHKATNLTFTDGATPISSGGLVLQGFMQSFRFTQSGFPAIQLDTAYSAFVQPGMLPDAVARLIDNGGGGRGGRGGRGFDRGGRGGGGGSGMAHGAGLSQLTDGQLSKLNKILRNAKFTVTHRQTNRVYSIKTLTHRPASELSFLLTGRDGKADTKVGVVQYFKTQYNANVTKPRLPCVMDFKYGNNSYVPMEFVKLLDYNPIPMTALTSDQTADMIRVAAKRPPERAGMIRQWRSNLNYDALPKLKAWGMEVNPKMMQVTGRVLIPPMITYGGGKTLRANNGGWNLKGVRFTKPGRPLVSWAMISFDRDIDVPRMERFATDLVKHLIQNGCPVTTKAPKLYHNDPNIGGPYANIKPSMATAARDAYMSTKTNPQLLIVIEPRKDTGLYAEVKRVGVEGLRAPVVTQVLLGTNFRKEGSSLDQYINNITMKIHAKMGGITHEVPVPTVLDSNTMMIGADVTHPPPSKPGAIAPSIAVSVAAIDGANNKFLPALRLQTGRTEIIGDLEAMMMKHIQDFEKNTRRKPSKIIFFRDGVSEGQYAQVVDKEVSAIRGAAARLGGGYKPKITFVICAKRHHMRFFAVKPADCDRTGNLPPGTTVDTKVTHPFAFDYFQQAHSGLQGTAKPTHYIVVVDENGFTAEKMQNLTNALSYTYARATRSVSMVPVAYYADVIAEKARNLIYIDDVSDGATVSSSATPSQPEFDPLHLKKRLEDHPEFNSVAWYM
ncbi:Piwi domain-domain-containing protein [Naematelia encephala]|uniref:Piwi domain-domain-containing protein n=1 Tax=Naematelia encephala TaxID=71784 RepID=A0A1Y2B6E2_9TREE|nr:Piwi domain-domain-containing protein [Naematelia encephala]